MRILIKRVPGSGFRIVYSFSVRREWNTNYSWPWRDPNSATLFSQMHRSVRTKGGSANKKIHSFLRVDCERDATQWILYKIRFTSLHACPWVNTHTQQADTHLYIHDTEHIRVHKSRILETHDTCAIYITHILEFVDFVGLLLIIMNYNYIYYINV